MNTRRQYKTSIFSYFSHKYDHIAENAFCAVLCIYSIYSKYIRQNKNVSQCRLIFIRCTFKAVNKQDQGLWGVCVTFDFASTHLGLEYLSKLSVGDTSIFF